METPIEVDFQGRSLGGGFVSRMVTRTADLEQRCGFTTAWRVVVLKELGGQRRKGVYADVGLRCRIARRSSCAHGAAGPAMYGCPFRRATVEKADQ
jgi:hypothetical protein